MSRGRKPKGRNSSLSWQYLFQRNAGRYFQLICESLRISALGEQETGSVLLNEIRTTNSFSRKNEKAFPILKDDEIPFQIPADWTWCRLGEVVSHNSGKTLDSGRNRGIARDFITTSNLYWGRFELGSVKKILVTNEELERCTAVKGDLLVCEGGEAGRAAVWNSDIPICFQNHIHRVRPFNNISSSFIYRYFQYLDQSGEINRHRKGMGISNLSGKALSLIPFPLAPIALQSKIVNFLDDLENESLNDQSYFDSHIEKKILGFHLAVLKSSELSTELTHQLDLVKQLRQAFLREAMQGKLVPQVASDEPASLLLQKIKAEKAQLIKEGKLKKEKELPPIKPEEIPFEIPKNWVWCRLGEIAENIEYGTSERAEMSSNHVPILRMNNIQDGKIDYTNLKYVKASIEDLPKLYLKEGDLLFNRTNSYELVGKAGVYHGPNNTMAFASYLIRVQFADRAAVDFLNYYINSSLCRTTQLEPEIIQQNGQANFNGTKLKNIICPLPPFPEQHRIVAKLEQLMHHCDELEQSIKQSQAQNEQLLQQVLREALSPKGKEYKIKDEMSLAAEE